MWSTQPSLTASLCVSGAREEVHVINCLGCLVLSPGGGLSSGSLVTLMAVPCGAVLPAAIVAPKNHFPWSLQSRGL